MLGLGLHGLPIFQAQMREHPVHGVEHASLFRPLVGMPRQREVHERLLAARGKPRNQRHFPRRVGWHLGGKVPVRHGSEFVRIAGDVADEPSSRSAVR